MGRQAMERIMIIDSDIRQMRELNDGLGSNYQILNCSRGEKALDLFKLYLPSALVLDPSTPELNVREFIRRVRSLPFRGELPILALAQITTLRQIEESFDWGVDMILSKPCSGEKAKKRLEEYLSRIGAKRLIHA
ncbi:MAG TPA: response regulator [Puia sp.]|nr:response regulator [Puia sp.]